MSIREFAPGDRGGEATQDVATLLGAITLPSIEPFGTDSPLLADLPAFVPIPLPTPEPPSRLGISRRKYDEAVEGLVALKLLENELAACKTALVAQLMGAAAAEAQAMSLDSWQRGISESSAHSELALVLCIPERTAASLAHHSTELIKRHPSTFQELREGSISSRHAWTVVDEAATLRETPGITEEQSATFEGRLLALAHGTTAASFISRARRAREATHPETIDIRAKRAHSERAMTLEPGKDGMSWLTLHLPSLAAEGIWVKCTRTARAIKNRPCSNAGGNDVSGCADVAGGAETAGELAENRTLGQLRVDVAAALLLGQQPLPGFSSGSGAEFPNEGARSAAEPWQGDGSGYARGLVDGIEENAAQEYLDQLAALQSNMLVAAPPLPEAVVLVTVPLLGALGITQEPAELVGSTPCSGPMSLDIARRLMLKTGSFLRVLTDPVTGEPLGLSPERYQLRESDKAVLRALNGGCYVPGCTNPVMDTETDHLKAFEYGGQTVLGNLHATCKRHHALRHFKDDKDRHGNYRHVMEPERHGLTIRGWTPVVDGEGNVTITSPSGRKYPQPYREPRPAIFPVWLQKLVDVATGLSPHEPGTRPGSPTNPTSPSEQLLIAYVKKRCS